MGFFDSLAEGSVTGLLKGAGTFAKDIRTAITGKEALSSEQQLDIVRQANALESAAANLESQAAKGQIDLNLVDAKSGSFFKSGWRPGIGWVCTSGLAYTFIIKPIFPWFINVNCILWGNTFVIPPLPSLDIKELMALTFCLLGFGGYRMYERIKGKA